jgi:sortase (surface protein transpeptidase)
MASLDDVSVARKDVAQAKPMQANTSEIFKPRNSESAIQEESPIKVSQPFKPSIIESAPVERPKGQIVSEINSVAVPKVQSTSITEKPHVFLVPAGTRTEPPSKPAAQIQEQPTQPPEPIPAQPILHDTQTTIEESLPSQASSVPKQNPQNSFTQSTAGKKPILSLTKMRVVVGVAVIIAVIGSFTAFQTLKSSHSAVAQISGAANPPVNATVGSSSPPSTIKPSANSILNYQVGLNEPRYLTIPKLNVHARVMVLGGSLSQTSVYPDNIYDTGWYDQSSLPGEPGAVIIAGHTSYNGSSGIFSNLINLVPGDHITVVRGDDIVFTYQVLKSVEYNDGNIDTQSVLKPVDPTYQSLNLVTAPGEGIPGVNQNKARLVVYTVQI